MDRHTVYSGQIPLETELLGAQQNAMVALAKFSAGVLGATTIVNGFTCVPTTPASLTVNLTKGEIYQLEALEATAWSSLAADTTDIILKQGIQLGTAQFNITPPGTSGFSQVFVIEAQYQDLDTVPIVLPYFNAGNPASPFMGPANSNSPQNTVRQGIVASQVKAGVAAPTGSQVTPTADAGWTPLFAVTVANGATTITAGNIAQFPFPAAPFIPVTLPNVPSGVQANLWTYAADQGNASNLAIIPFPTLAAYKAGVGFYVKAAFAPTGPSVINVFGQSGAYLGNVAIVNIDGSAIAANQWSAGSILLLVNDGSHFQLVSVATPAAPPVLTPPTKILELTGTGQSFSSNVITLITCFTTVARNTLSTSTWSGSALTIGSGEDGLWSIYAFSEFSSGYPYALYYNIIVVRTRAAGGAIEYYWPAGTYVPQPATQILLDLAVGDTIQLYGAVGSPGDTMQALGVGGAYRNAIFTRIEGLH